MGKTCLVWQVDNARGGVGGAGLAACFGLRLQPRLDSGKFFIGIAEGDPPEHGGRVFGRFQIRTGPAHIGGIPEFFLKLGAGIFGSGGFGPIHQLTGS